MAEHYSRYSKGSSRYREESTRSKTRRRKYSGDAKYSHLESKTPPLPSGNSVSIEELLRERESLKKELQKIGKYSVSNKQNEYKSSRDDNKKRKYSNDSTYKANKYDNNKFKHKDKINIQHSSPEYNALESEDEENIIELRRKQRKQLLEKLNAPSDTEYKNKDEHHHKYTSLQNKLPENTTVPKIEPITVTKATDMFSEKDDFVPNSTPKQVEIKNMDDNAQLTDNWDDAEGYYNIRTGDVVNNQYTIKDVLGQGVFANVVRAQDDNQGNSYVAIKIIRNNDLMYKTGLKEIAILKAINNADPDNKYHCVKFFDHFMHRGHLCLVLESLHMDLRCVLKKYGKNHGINMKALMSYSRQLLLALKLLKKIGIVHADIKPDNILVNEKKNILKLCDFGSAAKVDDNEPTPYLVSRFYRAPEIILGVPYKHGVDVWSTACTIYEMATGKILFTGNSNNKMLKCFMDLKGKIPNKLIRKGKFKDQHFNYNNNFLLHKKDEFSGREKVVEVSNINIVRDLHNELRKSCKNLASNEEKKLAQLKDLVDKMLMVDSSHRLSVTDCLKHPFIQEELTK